MGGLQSHSALTYLLVYLYLQKSRAISTRVGTEWCLDIDAANLSEVWPQSLLSIKLTSCVWFLSQFSSATWAEGISDLGDDVAQKC